MNAQASGYRRSPSCGCSQCRERPLVERVERVPLASPPPGGLLNRVLTFGGTPVSFEPSGEFAIEVWQYWGGERKRWKDKKSARLESLLPQLVAGVLRIALANRAEHEKRLAEEKERQRRAEELERLEKAIKAEQARVRRSGKRSSTGAVHTRCALSLLLLVKRRRRADSRSRQAQRSVTGWYGPSGRPIAWTRSQKAPSQYWTASRSWLPVIPCTFATANLRRRFGGRSRFGGWSSRLGKGSWFTEPRIIGR